MINTVLSKKRKWRCSVWAVFFWLSVLSFTHIEWSHLLSSINIVYTCMQSRWNCSFLYGKLITNCCQHLTRAVKHVKGCWWWPQWNSLDVNTFLFVCCTCTQSWCFEPSQPQRITSRLTCTQGHSSIHDNHWVKKQSNISTHHTYTFCQQLQKKKKTADLFRLDSVS